MSSTRDTRDRLRAIAVISPLGSTMAVLAAAASLLILVVLANALGLQVPFLSSGRFTMLADFSNADGLAQGEKPAVMVAGVQLGRVTDVRYVDGYAQATLSLDDSARRKIFRNATVLISPRSALNDLTVDIEPGSPSAGPLPVGAVIPQTQTQPAVNFDELTSVLNLDTRSQLAAVIDALGIGLHGRSSSIDQALVELQPFLGDTSRLAAEMAVHRQMLSRLISDLDVVFTTLGQRGQQLRTIISAGEGTLGVVAEHQAGVEQTMSALAPALRNVSRSLYAVNTLSRPLDPALTELKPLARALPGALSQLRSFVPPGEQLLGDLRTLDREGPPGVVSLHSLLQKLAPASNALEPTVRDLLPVTTALDRYPQGIGELGSNFSGVFSDQNANGPTMRAYGFFEPPLPENFGLPVGTSASSLARMKTQLALALDHVCVTSNPLACLARYLTPQLPIPKHTDRGLR